MIGQFELNDVNTIQRMIECSNFPIIKVANQGQNGFNFHEFHVDKKLWQVPYEGGFKAGFFINLLAVVEKELGWKLVCKTQMSNWVFTHSIKNRNNTTNHYYSRGCDTLIFEKNVIPENAAILVIEK